MNESKLNFRGFQSPNYTQVPDELFDCLLPTLTEGELKILLYIIRRTLGFKKRLDSISLRQLEKGLPGKDSGVGLKRRGIIYALQKLEKKNIISVIRQKDEHNINEINYYSLRFSGENRGSASECTRVVHPDSLRSAFDNKKVVHPGAPNNKQNTQYTEKQEKPSAASLYEAKTGKNGKNGRPSQETLQRLNDAVLQLQVKKDENFDPILYIRAHIKANIPADVTLYVMEEFVKYKEGIDNLWAYGQTVLKRSQPEYNFNQALAEHYFYKNQSVEIGSLLRGNS